MNDFISVRIDTLICAWGGKQKHHKHLNTTTHTKKNGPLFVLQDEHKHSYNVKAFSLSELYRSMQTKNDESIKKVKRRRKIRKLKGNDMELKIDNKRKIKLQKSK